MTEQTHEAIRRITIPRRFDEPLRFSFQGWKGVFRTRWPEIEGQATRPPENGHLRRATFHYRLGGEHGRIVEDVWHQQGIELARQVWIPSQEQASALAVRLRVRKQTGSPIRLVALEPIHFEGAGAFRCDGSQTGDWEILCQKRDKNEVPATRKLGEFPLETALDEEGQATRREEVGALKLAGDPFMLFRSGTRTDDCLLGFLGGTDALSELNLTTNDHRTSLNTLGARCALDGVELPVGGERYSEWALLLGGGSGWGLVENFAERVGAHHRVKLPPPHPPSVWCSWYHYGNEFNEADLHEELRGLSERGVPFDVVLIDDFRPRAWGDWFECPLWPSGLEDAVRRIREAGFRPGFWTAPFVVEPDSTLALAHPEWFLRREDGTPVTFSGQRHNPEPEPDPNDPDGDPFFRRILSEFNVLDPTYPGVEDFFEELYRRLSGAIGFSYFKFDFMRAVTDDPKARFYDRSATRAQAYRRGLHAIRRGAGPEAYLSVCGGHYGASIGLADSQRSGADVDAHWGDPPPTPKLKQNLLRTWMNRFWHTDADALMIRRRPKPVAPTFAKRLSIGRLSDDEARIMAVNQYVGGGMVCGTEHFADLDEDRLELYRHVLPPLRNPGFPLDPFHPAAPTQIRNRVCPLCADLDPWITLAVFNWEDEAKSADIRLTDSVLQGLAGDRFIVFDFFRQEVIGYFSRNDPLPNASIPAHGVRLLRIAPWDGEQPILAGTDRHFSGGGTEIAEWSVRDRVVKLRVESPWKKPVAVHLAFPSEPSPQLLSIRVQPGETTRVSPADELRKPSRPI